MRSRDFVVSFVRYISNGEQTLDMKTTLSLHKYMINNVILPWMPKLLFCNVIFFLSVSCCLESRICYANIISRKWIFRQEARSSRMSIIPKDWLPTARCFGRWIFQDWFVMELKE